MANGFLSQLAAARSAQQSLGGLAGLQLRRTGLEEMRTVEDEIRTMEEKLAEEQESARKREGRRGRGRLAGLLAGAGLALATGGTSLAVGLAGGAGSLLGQEIGSRYSISRKGIESRKRHLDRIRSGLKPGLFHSGARKDIESRREDLNRFLKEADRMFDQSVLTSAVTDAISAGRFAGSELGASAGGFLRGETTLKELLKAGAVKPKSLLGSKKKEDLGIAMFPDYMGEVRDAYQEMFPDRGISFSDFLGGLNLPGQGFGQFFDAGGQR